MLSVRKEYVFFLCNIIIMRLVSKETTKKHLSQSGNYASQASFENIDLDTPVSHLQN